MDLISRILTSSAIVLMLSGCGSGGNDETTIIEPIIETTPGTADLVLAMQSASLTNSIDFYLLPDSDDFENIPQDPMNPITAERVEVVGVRCEAPTFIKSLSLLHTLFG